VDSDDGDGDNGFRPPEGGSVDLGLFRAAAVVVILGGLLVAAWFVFVRGDDGSGTVGITTEARDSMPALPDGLVAVSDLYDITVSEGIAGAATLKVRLSGDETPTTNLALYTYSDGQWRRLGSATIDDGGRVASGDVQSVPANIAVLHRAALARALGLIVGPGEAPDAAATGASIVSVIAGGPLTDTDEAGLVSADVAALSTATAATDAAVYLGLTAREGAAAQMVELILGTPARIETHVGEIVLAALAANAGGVHIDYTAVDAARREAFTSFASQLSVALAAERLGFVVSVPTPPLTGTDAYDWQALAGVAETLWLRPPADPAGYYDELEPALGAQRAAGADLGAVWLVLDRRSTERSADGLAAISLREALTLASGLVARFDDGITPGSPVTISGVNINESDDDSGMRWDETANAVTFNYGARGGAHSVWLENRFSAAFRLDLARRFGLGGVVVEPAAQDETLPDFWNTVATFVEDGSVLRELPYGPYLRPSWRSSAGSIEGGEGGEAVWRAPDEVGVYDITLVVSDGVVFVGQQIALRVSEGQQEPAPTSTPEPTATATPAPTASPTPAPAATTAPAATPQPTAQPTASPTPEPTPSPTPEPTATPSGPPGPAGN
jgi:cell division septation protein DedD